MMTMQKLLRVIKNKNPPAGAEGFMPKLHLTHSYNGFCAGTVELVVFTFSGGRECVFCFFVLNTSIPIIRKKAGALNQFRSFPLCILFE
jgi:hypothetical protein